MRVHTCTKHRPFSRLNGTSYIYAHLDWKDYPAFSAGFMLLLMFVILPILVCTATST